MTYCESVGSEAGEGGVKGDVTRDNCTRSTASRFVGAGERGVTGGYM